MRCVGRCGDPPVIEHASRDGPIGQKVFPLGTQLTYSCAPGYSLGQGATFYSLVETLCSPGTVLTGSSGPCVSARDAGSDLV